MTLDQFITMARKLVSECRYPSNGERLLRDIIVSEVNSKSAYTKCVKRSHYTRVCRSKNSPKKRDDPHARLDSLEKAIKQLTVTVHYRASPPPSPTKELVDCITKDYTNINFEDTKTVFKLQTSTTSTKAHQAASTQDHNNEQMRPIWISESPNSKVTQSICEVDTGAGCNVISTNQAKELFQTE